MILKNDVQVLGIKPELLIALMVADSVYRNNETELVVTELTGGTHAVKSSRHYSGCAADLRIKNILGGTARVEKIVNEIKAGLSKDYDVVLEYDPKS